MASRSSRSPPSRGQEGEQEPKRSGRDTPRSHCPTPAPASSRPAGMPADRTCSPRPVSCHALPDAGYPPVFASRPWCSKRARSFEIWPSSLTAASGRDLAVGGVRPLLAESRDGRENLMRQCGHAKPDVRGGCSGGDLLGLSPAARGAAGADELAALTGRALRLLERAVRVDYRFAVRRQPPRLHLAAGVRLRVLDQTLAGQTLQHPRDLALIGQADDLRDFTVIQTRPARDRRQRHLRTDRQPVVHRRSRPQRTARETIAIPPSCRRRRARDGRSSSFAAAALPR